MALVIDAIIEVVNLTEHDVITAEQILANLGYVTGVIKRIDGLMLIHDLDRLLPLDEEHTLHDAIELMNR